MKKNKTTECFRKPEEKCLHCGFKEVTTAELIGMLQEVDPTGNRKVWVVGKDGDVATPLLRAYLDYSKRRVVYLQTAGIKWWNTI